VTKDEKIKKVSFEKLYRRCYKMKLDELNEKIDMLEELKKK
jgi:hypothetical protein